MIERLPRIGLTLGDVAGIGPEIVARAFSERRLRESCRPVVIGHPSVMERALNLIGATFNLVSVDSLADVDWSSESISCWNPSGIEFSDIPIGGIDARAGQAAYEYLVSATHAALRFEIDAITTAPLAFLAAV